MNVRTTSVNETKFYSQKQKKEKFGKMGNEKKKERKKKLVYCCLESPGVDD